MPPLTTATFIGLGLVTALLALGSFDSFLGGIVYVATFPLWAPLGLIAGVSAAAFRALKAPWRTLLLVAPRLARFYRSPWTALAHIVLALALDMAVFATASPVKLRFLLMALVAVTINTVLLTFFVPPSLLVSRTLLSFVRRHAVRERLLGSVVSRRLRIWPDAEELDKARGTLDLLARGRDWLRVLVQRLTTRRAVVLSFLLQLIIVLLIVAINFGFLYHAAARLEPNFFGCTNQTITLSQAIFFSFTTITTAGGSAFCASSGIAMAFVLSEILCGLLLLSVAGLGFTTLYPTDTRVIKQELAAVLAHCDKEIEEIRRLLTLAEGLAILGKVPNHDLVVARSGHGKTLSQAWAELIEEASK